MGRSQLMQWKRISCFRRPAASSSDIICVCCCWIGCESFLIITKHETNTDNNQTSEWTKEKNPMNYFWILCAKTKHGELFNNNNQKPKNYIWELTANLFNLFSCFSNLSRKASSSERFIFPSISTFILSRSCFCVSSLNKSVVSENYIFRKFTWTLNFCIQSLIFCDNSLQAELKSFFKTRLSISRLSAFWK
jgi:hypothetical protein